MDTTTVPSVHPSPRHMGPPLLLTSGIYVLLALCGVFSGKLLAPHVPFAMPFDTVASEVEYLQKAAAAMRWGAFFQFGSAFPLLVFTATISSRLRFLGVQAAGEAIAFCGGVAASILLVVSALAGWALSTPDMASLPGAVRALQLLCFMTGGPGFAALVGLFYTGVAVVSGLHRLIPKWLMWSGLVLGICAMLSTFTLLTWKAAIFIPIGRFLGMVWILAIASRFPTRRGELHNARP